MVKIFCDICKEDISDASTTYTWNTKEMNYRALLDKSLCYDCMKKFDEEVKTRMDGKSEYGFLEYNRVMKETLEEMCE